MTEPTPDGFPKDQFEMRRTIMPDGGALMQFELKGDYLESVEDQAWLHGMTLQEWLEYVLCPERSRWRRIKARLFPIWRALCGRVLDQLDRLKSKGPGDDA